MTPEERDRVQKTNAEWWHERERLRLALRAVQRLKIIYDGPPRNSEYDAEAVVSLQIRTALDGEVDAN